MAFFTPPAITATLAEYEAQATALRDAARAGHLEALGFFHCHLPRLLDDEVRWLPKPLSEAQLRTEVFDEADARTAIARGYDFADWGALTAFVHAMEQRDPAVYPFERAVDAVVHGDLAALKSLLAAHPELPQARSTRVTHFDPPVHRATLLHYLAANGTENFRQRTPANALDVAKVLLDAGAEVNALANLYGGECTTLSLLVSSHYPAEAGLQIPLVELLLARGASVGEMGQGHWVSPVETALLFGYPDAARTLAQRGGFLSLAAAAGLGEAGEVRAQLAAAPPLARHRALALAAQAGQVETARILLDAGEDPNRFNPPGTHAHSTPLHQAAVSGHLAVVKLLVESGARGDIRDHIYDGTPLDWAHHGGQGAVVAFLEKQSNAG